MALPVLFALLLAAQVSGERSDHRRSVEAVLDRASKERDLDGAGVVLSALLSDESRLRRGFLDVCRLGRASSYILFAGNWGSVADVTWTDRRRWQRIRVESASVTPAMIRSLIRADRYESYFDRRRPRGAATINIFPLFSGASFADDLVEEYVEHLMAESAKPATAIEFPLRGKRADPLIMVTADEVEQDLLCTWQMICGVCDRLDLIRGADHEELARPVFRFRSLVSKEQAVHGLGRKQVLHTDR